MQLKILLTNIEKDRMETRIILYTQVFQNSILI